MSSFVINLDLQLRGEDKFRRAIRTVGQLEAALKKVGKEVDIAGKLPGRGKEADQIGTVTKRLNDLAKKLVQTGSSGKKTQAGVADLTSAFKALSASSNTASLSFKNFVEATVVAEREANKLARAEENIRRAFLGMQSVEEREAQLERRANLLRNLRTRKKLKEEEARVREKNAKAAEREAKALERQAKAEKRRQASRRNVLGDAAQGAILGGGFPLLFGGPSFSAVGGLLGGGLAGGIGGQQASFAGGILGSVLGKPFDAITQSAIELGKALESPTKNIQQLVDVLPLAGSKTKGLIGDLQELGLDSVAGALAVQELNDQLGALGLQDVDKLKEGTDALSNAFKELKLLGIAFAAPGLVNGVQMLTKLIVGIKQDQGFLARATRATLSFLTRSDATADFQNRKGPFANTPQATLETLEKQNKAKQLTERQLQVQGLVNSIRSQTVGLAEIEAQIEANRLNLIRGELQVVQAAVEVDRAQLALDKANLNVIAETNESEKARLIVKRDVAAAALIEARAAKENAIILARQSQAAFELERATKNQAISMADMTAEIAAQQAIRATSPFENQGFMMDPYFGGSRKLESEQNQKFAETLRLMNAELDNVNKNIEFGTDLDHEAKLALVDKRIELENNIARYKEYQPAIDQAALAQMRFNEALALTVPVTDSLFDNLVAVVEGTKTAKEAFASFLRDIASLLMDAAKQMIATYIAIGIARAFAGMGSGGGGDGLNLTAVEQYSGIGANTPVTPFAEGGYVSGPTNALVGEAGEPEYVIPESKMRESMARYSRGARGSSVIPETGDSGTSGEGGGVAVAAPIDVRYTVERINSVDYVTADQFQRGMQQAAADGAKQGEQRALTTLRQNTSQRRRIGL